MMQSLLLVFCLIVGLSSTVDGFCFQQGPTVTANILKSKIQQFLVWMLRLKTVKDCVYKGRIITNGTDYESTVDCIKCSCSKGFLGCCSIGIRITSKPDDCKVVPDGPCSQKAVLIADETKPCPGGIGAVGR